MAAAAIRAGRSRCQSGLGSPIRVASRALGMFGEGRILAAGLELMAIRAIGTKAGGGVNAGFLIDVPGMRKLKQQSPVTPIAWKREQIVLAGRRIAGMALRADLLVDVIEQFLVAHGALGMTGTPELH